jgi:hypothetical protein
MMVFVPALEDAELLCTVVSPKRRGLTIAPWSHHSGIFHRFLVSDTAITKNYLDSSAATMDLPQHLKSTRWSQMIPIK